MKDFNVPSVIEELLEEVDRLKAENEKLKSWEYLSEVIIYAENLMPTQDENFTIEDAARCWVRGDNWRKVNE